MINVNVAIKESQRVNRNNWLNHASDVISAKIMNVAHTGMREMEISMKDFVTGAENLDEAAEMLQMLSGVLEKSGFKHKITINGDLIISW